jgi:hypothetical protein
MVLRRGVAEGDKVRKLACKQRTNGSDDKILTLHVIRLAIETTSSSSSLKQRFRSKGGAHPLQQPP